MPRTLRMEEVEEETRAVGQRLLSLALRSSPRLLDPETAAGRLVAATADDPGAKTALFRFVDLYPSLRSPAEVRRHAVEYFPNGLPGLGGVAGDVAGLARTLSESIEELARGFLLGRDPTEALPALSDLHAAGLGFTVDFLGEATLGGQEADAYRDRYLDLLEVISPEAARWPRHPAVDAGHPEPAPRCNVSLKLSALEPHLPPQDPCGAVERLGARLLPILRSARRVGASVHLDLEQWELHGIALDVFEAMADHPEFRDWPHLGITLQSYLRESRADLHRLLGLARRRRTPLGVRLVKGAYWDAEVVRARQFGYPCPVFTEKARTDASYEALSLAVLRNHRWLRGAFAGHNLRSLGHVAACAKLLGLPQEAVEFQVLHGLADPERDALRTLGFRVREYTPVGQAVPGMAYLVRRLLEITSTDGFLRLAHGGTAEPGALLSRPGSRRGRRRPAAALLSPETSFRNTGHTDFVRAADRRAFALAVERVGRELPLRAPVVVDGKELSGAPVLT
ncbi:MAG: proline dehydrogenase family protein, partial [Proteobacteria bacterium]|nr:proline dehydrogenase family protein [Pseudomonadota bacterium]